MTRQPCLVCGSHSHEAHFRRRSLKDCVVSLTDKGRAEWKALNGDEARRPCVRDDVPR